MKPIDAAKARELFKSKFWEAMDHRQRAQFQLFTDVLCMPFAVFHEALEKSLGRPVFTHEFGLDVEGLRSEFLGQRPRPTMEEILGLLPAERTIVAVLAE